MRIDSIPEWVAALDEEELRFVRSFVLASGSLKETAHIYGVTYPTVRLRLDRLIQKIRISEDAARDSHVGLIRQLLLEDRLDPEAARMLLSSYRAQNKEDARP